MEKLSDEDKHIHGPLFLHHKKIPYQPVSIDKVDDFFFAPVLQHNWSPNDCGLAALNHFFRQLIFATRWQGHNVYNRYSKRG